MTADGDIVLEVRGISKAFPGVKALQDVDLTLRRGRLTALLGENGAGKSTLMNIVAGVLTPDAGRMVLEGEEVRFSGPRAARDAGIAMIFQELNLVPHMTVAENIFLGREPVNALGFVDYGTMNRATTEVMKQLELPLSPTTEVGTLRVGQQQVVEIAKALVGSARILIMDEPTSALTGHEVEVLFRIITQLKQKGVAIAYITHKFEELMRIGDDAIIMRDGRLVGTAPLANLTHEEIVKLMVGRERGALAERTETAPGDEALRVEELSMKHPERAGDFLLKGVGLSVRRGEVLGIFGLMGAGRTELLECIFRLHGGAVRGAISVDGQRATIASPQRAIELGLALAPEDRKREGLVLEMSVGENAGLASVSRFTHLGFIRPRAERAHVEKAIERFRVKTPSLAQRIRNLSGGNQQKVILGKWLATRPKVLLLDEPTRGIDVGAKREIYQLIDELKREGLAVVMVSSELPEVLAVADRVMVMCEGKRTAEFERSEATEERVMAAALPKSDGTRKGAE